MKLMSSIFKRMMVRWMMHNGVSEENVDEFFRNTLSAKNLLFDFFWHKTNDALSEKIAYRRNAIQSIPDRDAVAYMDELAYIRTQPPGEWIVFPYPKVRAPKSYECGYLKGVKLPFVVHNGMRLFFPKWMKVDDAVRLYRYFMEEEGIVGEGLRSVSPHCYQTMDFKVEEGDVVLDIGCSEALFALDSIALASRVYVFETLKYWRRPNIETFRPFKDKVEVINKFVGAVSNGDMVRLDDAVKGNSQGATYFIKIDIEGGERTVIESSADFLKGHRVKLACAAYHRQDDADFLSEQLRRLGFAVEFSKGYMLPLMKDFVYPYFRKCMIYARNF